jgi:hypothetical protein
VNTTKDKGSIKDRRRRAGSRLLVIIVKDGYVDDSKSYVKMHFFAPMFGRTYNN